MKLLWGKHQRNKDRQDPSRSVICWDWHSLGNCHHLCFLAVFPMRIHPRRPSCLQSFTDSLSRQAMLSLSQSQDASIEASSPLLETLNDGTGRYSRWNRKWFREAVREETLSSLQICPHHRSLSFLGMLSHDRWTDLLSDHWFPDQHLCYESNECKAESGLEKLENEISLLTFYSSQHFFLFQSLFGTFHGIESYNEWSIWEVNRFHLWSLLGIQSPCKRQVNYVEKTSEPRLNPKERPKGIHDIIHRYLPRPTTKNQGNQRVLDLWIGLWFTHIRSLFHWHPSSIPCELWERESVHRNRDATEITVQL